MTSSEATGPGLLYVNSKIISSDLSPELFTKWYEDEHIPDIFVTSGIKSAFRYYTIDQSVERPYLALYPLKDVTFLQSDEFKAIPVHSNLLPNESKAIFELADFDTRYYTCVGQFESQGISQEPTPFIATLQFDLPPDLQDAPSREIQTWYASRVGKVESTSARVRLYKLFFARQNRLTQEEKNLAEPPKLLALNEFGSEADLDRFLKGVTSDETAASFKLLRAFGNTSHNF